jgi:transposase
LVDTQNEEGGMALTGVHMAPRARRTFSAAFKAETVELIRSSGKTIGQVCRDLDLTETAVRRWVQQAEIDAGKRPGLTTAERAELAELRRENRVLREEREILKKAAAFFARETTR